MDQNQYIEAAKIVNTHGIGGDVVAESYCDSPDILRKLPSLFLKTATGYHKLEIKKASLFKGRVLFHFCGYDTIETAIPLKNKMIYALREDFHLQEGEFFIRDLIGLPVYHVNDGTVYGKVSDVLNYGAQDLYEILKPDGQKVLIPVVKEFVKAVDLEKGIAISPIEGLI